MRTVIATVITILALVLAPVSFAGHNKGYCPKLMAKMTEALSLDDAQVEKIKQIKQHAYQLMKADKKQLKILDGKFNDVVYSDKLNMSNLDAMVKIKASILERKMKVKYMMKHQIYAILNTEQKEKFKAFWADKRKAYHKKHQH